jgi:hypothetical protein
MRHVRFGFSSLFILTLLQAPGVYLRSKLSKPALGFRFTGIAASGARRKQHSAGSRTAHTQGMPSSCTRRILVLVEGVEGEGGVGLVPGAAELAALRHC